MNNNNTSAWVMRMWDIKQYSDQIQSYIICVLLGSESVWWKASEW